MRREPESSRWRREVIPEVDGCPWDLRTVDHTSTPDAFSRVAVFGDHAPAVPAAAAGAAEAPQPDDDWADVANTPITASGRTDVHHRCGGEEVRCLCGLSQMPERNACRAHPLSSMAPQTSVVPEAPAVDMAVESTTARGEKRGHEDRGGDALMESPTICMGRQVAAASRNRVRAARFAGSWDSRPGPLRRRQVLKKRSSWRRGGTAGVQEVVGNSTPTDALSWRGSGGAGAGGSHPSEAGVRHEVGNRA